MERAETKRWQHCIAHPDAETRSRDDKQGNPNLVHCRQELTFSIFKKNIDSVVQSRQNWAMDSFSIFLTVIAFIFPFNPSPVTQVLIYFFFLISYHQQ